MHHLLYDIWKNQRKTLFVHVLCWGIFIFSEVIVVGLLNNHFSNFSYYLCFYLLNICLFYFHADWLFKHTKNPNKAFIWTLVPFLILELTFYIVIAIALLFTLQIIHPSKSHEEVLTRRFFIANIWRGLYFMIYATGYFFLISYLRKQKREMKKALEIINLKNQLLTTQTDYLRSQINPHLLFNTLNFIKYAAKHHPENAREAVNTLSDIMEYALEDSKGIFVPISKEIAQIENIIRLNQFRYGGTLNIEFYKTIEDDQSPILPIVLLTLVENIFKHGDLRDNSHPAVIELKCDKASLFFKTSNLVSNTELPNKKIHTGLKNIQSRLESNYPNRYYFGSERTGNLFLSELRIDF